MSESFHTRDADGRATDGAPVDLSVVLCTWNNAGRLRITLEAIARCEVPHALRWELVIVDNNSTDDTRQVASEFACRLPIRYVFEPVQGLSRARNAGLAKARGRLIVFTDDDVVPAENWLKDYWQAFAEKPAGYYFGGPLESEFDGVGPSEDVLPHAPASVRGLDWGPVPRELVRHEYLLSANWSCPRAALDEVGKFDESLGLNAGESGLQAGEETELMRRLQGAGWRPWYVPSARITHFVPAEKCSLEHIADRKAAARYVAARTGRSLDGTSAARRYGRLLLLYGRATVWRLAYSTSRALGRKWQVPYLKWRATAATLSGIRDGMRERARWTVDDRFRDR